ncbi:type IV pilin N-terminal domain-containing protein [Halorussus salilacus]|uniref:type IV pilin n=1 Tax=Halorussus salilacus TaxID=2953750 RepID=UPI0020A21C92|nr:type IV pilin N-terminal domain-containing protein [Halorussus salilacus]USZ68335.1 type IV pilin N-terminal domain-containing protein [Halorussus salilacus]
MKLKTLFEDDGAVSPVIGVILMVAITVILAAVIGTFVLGLGDQVSEASPNSQFGFGYGTAEGGSDYVNITHDGGEGVNTDQISVQIGGTLAWNGTSEYTEYKTGGDNDFVNAGGTNGWDKEKITAGDSLDIQENGADMTDGDSVKVIWNAPGSDKTAVIGESEVSL